MKKTFVVDTSTLIHDPMSVHSFEDNDVVIPAAVVYELDALKTAPNGRGFSAREVIRLLEEHRSDHPTLEGVPLGEDCGFLTVDSQFDGSKPDDQIIACAKRLAAGGPVVVVSKDIGMRIKCSAIHGVDAQDYLNSRVREDDGYTGIHPEPVVVTLGPNDDLHQKGVESPPDILQNEFCYVVCEGYESVGEVLCRRQGDLLLPVPNYGKKSCGLSPRDDYQRMAMDVLLDPDIVCVVLTGVAGSGKTLLSLAASLNYLEHGEVGTVMCMKPIVPVGGRDLGYLKGDKQEKLEAWSKPFYDNLKVLGMYKEKNSEWEDNLELEMEAMTYMRGRTLHGYSVIADEFQNTTRHEARTILSRIGEKTKCIVLADLTQIDNPFVDAQSCGAAAAIEGLKGDPSFACVHLKNSHRSAFAQTVADRLG